MGHPDSVPQSTNLRVLQLLSRYLNRDEVKRVIGWERRFPGTIAAGLEYAAYTRRRKPDIACFASGLTDQAVERVTRAAEPRMEDPDMLAWLEEFLCQARFNPVTLKLTEYQSAEGDERQWSRECEALFAIFVRRGSQADLEALVDQAVEDEQAILKEFRDGPERPDLDEDTIDAASSYREAMHMGGL